MQPQLPLALYRGRLSGAGLCLDCRFLQLVGCPSMAEPVKNSRGKQREQWLYWSNEPVIAKCRGVDDRESHDRYAENPRGEVTAAYPPPGKGNQQ